MTGPTRLTIFAALATVLGSVALLPTLAGQGWFWPATGAVLSVALAGELARRYSVPRVFVPLVSLAALVLYLTWRFASDEAWAGVVPTRAAVTAMLDLARAGSADIDQFAPPVPVGHGLLLIICAGVGGVALVVDTLAVTMRRAALAGLPLLALYTVPAAVIEGGAGAWTFAVVSVGYIALLLAEGRERLTRWGRPVGYVEDPGTRHVSRPADLETSPIAQVGRRIGLASLGLAVVVPLIVPGLDEAVLGNGGGDGTGGGRRTITTINPILSVQRDLQRPDELEVLRYRTNATAPQYLRVISLDRFNGQTWDTSVAIPDSQQVSDGLPEPPGLSAAVARAEVRTEIDVGTDLRYQWLPLPYPPRSVDVEGDWRYDGQSLVVVSRDRDRSTAGQSYGVTSLAVDPSPQQLDAAGDAPSDLESLTQLPADISPLVGRLAASVTEDARTPYRKALALQRWLTDPDNFSYDQDVRTASDDPLRDFLTDRRGYCVQFAGAMAAMARTLGIPARVDVGFTPGQATGPGVFVVTTHDAHAWPELFFPGVGWVRFEPTPLGDGRAVTPAYADPTSPGVGALGNPGGSSTGGNDPGSPNSVDREAINRLERLGNTGDNTPATPTDVPTAPADEPTPRWPFVVAAIAVLALLAPAALRLLTRRHRWRAATDALTSARAAWGDLRDTARDLGYGWVGSETPRGVARRLAADARLAERPVASLERVARFVERARFARDAGDIGDLRGDVAVVRAGLFDGARRRSRWRARLWPSSSLTTLAKLSDRGADVLDWLDRTGARAWARLSPRRSG